MKISIIGTGNVAYHMVRAISGLANHKLISVCGTSIENVKSISIKTKAVLHPSKILKSDLILICVPDDKIGKVAKEVSRWPKHSNTIIAHTSGSVSSKVLKSNLKYGVFYPLQTFTKGQRLSYKSIPFCITGSDEKVIRKLMKLANEISDEVQMVTDKQRKEVHLSAVLINNLVNHIIYLSQKRLTDHNIDPNLLLPLIKETVNKLSKIEAFDAQTGPARRGDQKIIEQHIKSLSDDHNLKEIYSVVTKSIIKTYL